MTDEHTLARSLIFMLHNTSGSLQETQTLHKSPRLIATHSAELLARIGKESSRCDALISLSDLA